MATTFDVSTMPQQKAFMEDTSKELLYSGAFGAGKTRVGCEKGFMLSAKYPKNSGAIFRKTRSSLTSTTQQTWFEEVCPPSMIKNWNKQEGVCELVNGSLIYFRGLDDPLKIGSMNLGWAFLDEGIEAEEDDYNMILSRLRRPNVPIRQIFIATNPGSPYHWIYTRFFKEKHGSVYEGNSLQNPHLPKDYVDFIKTKYTGVYYRRYVLGEWIGQEGMVYEEFDPLIHEIEPFGIPIDWPRYRFIDFGYTNPFVCQWWAKVPEPADGTQDTYPVIGGYPRKGYYLYREIYMSRRTIEDHAKDILKHSPLSQETNSTTIADWDAGDREILHKNGIATIEANKEVEAGIQSTREELVKGNIHIFKNALVERDPLLDESSKPLSTAAEMYSYIWDKNKADTNFKEVPRKLYDHGMDAMRYGLHTIKAGPQKGSVRVGKKQQRRNQVVFGRRTSWRDEKLKNWRNF